MIVNVARNSLLCLLFSLFLLGPVAADEKAFGGVGLQVVPTVEGNLVVLNVLKGAPADQKGVRPGDLIFKVDDFLLAGSDFGEVVSNYLWGPVGSAVEVSYLRPGVPGESKVTLQRTEISPQMTVTPTVQSGSATAQRSQ